VVELPGLPEKGDVTDWRRAGHTAEELRALAAAAPLTEAGLAALRARWSPEPSTVKPVRCVPFQVTDEGVLWLKKSDDGTVEPVRIAARIDVLAATRDNRGDNWGRILRWTDAEDREHTWSMPMEHLSAGGEAVRARLLCEGLSFVTTNARLREKLTEYLQTWPVERRARCVTRIGWHGNTFVLPDRAIGPEGAEEVLYQTPHEAMHYWQVAGTAEDWREHIGRRCRGNSRLMIGASCGFAGPLLRLVSAESGGIHYIGGTSTGKTTCLVVGGSVCGGGGQVGFVQTWRATLNGLEAIAEAHNDATLFLDELPQVDAREAAETAYLLATGQGKSRMTRSIGARKKLAWSILFVSAGEVTLAEHARSVGKRTRGGAEVRLLNIDADAGKALGIFETIHDSPSPDVFARELKEAARRYYGAPFRTYLERLTQDPAGVERSIRAGRDAFHRLYLPTDAAGEVRRAADRFSLIGAAGELATGWDLTGWAEGDAMSAAARCFRGWMDRRGTAGSSDTETAIRQVRAFLEAHGASRFQAVKGEGVEEAQPIRDRAGFRRRSTEGETEYLILPEVFRGEVCSGHSYRAVLAALEERGFLVRSPPDYTIKPRLPELGTVRVYCVRAAILGGEEC